MNKHIGKIKALGLDQELNLGLALTRAQSRKRARRAADVIHNLAAKQPCHEVHVATWLG